jgi:hypothetical protein
MGQKLKNCSWATWATTRAMALVALVLDPPMGVAKKINEIHNGY